MTSVYKLHIHKWAAKQQTNLVSVMLAQRIAAQTDGIHEVMMWLRDGKVDPLLPGKPGSEEWFSLYADHHRVQKAVADHFPQVLGVGDKLEDRLSLIRGFGVWARHEPEEVKEWLESMGRERLNRWFWAGMQRWQRTYRRHLADLKREFRGNKCKVRDLGAMMKASPEMLFYFRVLLPCVCIYQTHPASLLRKARRESNGREIFIEKLTRIDDMAEQEPSIERWRNEPDGSVRQGRIEQLRHWSARGLNDGQLSLNRVKASMGGLIWAIVDYCGAYWLPGQKGMRPVTITAEDIRELFHSVAQDRARGAGKSGPGICDNELAELQTASWRRALSRSRRLWSKFLSGKA